MKTLPDELPGRRGAERQLYLLILVTFIMSAAVGVMGSFAGPGSDAPGPTESRRTGLAAKPCTAGSCHSVFLEAASAARRAVREQPQACLLRLPAPMQTPR